MRLASVRVERSWRTAAVSEDPAEVALLPTELGTVDDLVRGGPEALERARAAVRRAETRPLAEVAFGPPLRRFHRDVLCTGWNYLDHFYESQGKREGQEPRTLPEHPTFFSKGPDTVIGPEDEIAYDPALSHDWDYEAEVAVVIGRDGRSIPEEAALNHVFGYFVANDVSLRDVQRAHGGQWLKGKSIDGTMPIGPWITTPEDLLDPRALLVECELNGEVLQHASTAEMAFGFDRLIAELSRGMTLRAGDVLLTGTPSGVGNAREPAVFLKGGDLLVTRVTGLGELRNRVSIGASA